MFSHRVLKAVKAERGHWLVNSKQVEPVNKEILDFDLHLSPIKPAGGNRVSDRFPTLGDLELAWLQVWLDHEVRASVLIVVG